MPRKGENIYKRKDGRWEARYIYAFKEDGSPRYRSIYAADYLTVKKKQNDAKRKMDPRLFQSVRMKKNISFFLTSVYEFEIDKITKSNDIIKDYSLGNTIVFPDEYKDECGLFKDSKLYQDGILLDILPQCIVPIGVTYVSVNLTGKSRFELNVSRHELNKNREVIKKWGQKAGKIIQRKVVQNCKQVFEENGLEYDQEDLLVAKGNDDFAKECYENMKNILSEVEG